MFLMKNNEDHVKPVHIIILWLTNLISLLGALYVSVLQQMHKILRRMPRYYTEGLKRRSEV
jgi:hypothetical protein